MIDAQLDYIITGEKKYYDLVMNMTNYMRTLIKPLSFDAGDKDSFNNTIDRNFVNSCFSMRKVGVVEPEKLTVFEWEIAIDNFEKEMQERQKNGH